MAKSGHIIGEKERVGKLHYDLFKAFDTAGNPLYESGVVEDSILLQEIKDSINASLVSANQYSVVSMGHLLMVLDNGNTIKIGLVYDQGAGRYTNLIYIGNRLHVTTGKLAAIVERLRTQ